MSILHPCPTCGKLTPDSHCPAHAKAKRRKRYARQDASRRARGKRNGSTYVYRKARAYVLQRDKGICWLCGRSGADSADHVRAVSRGGTDDPSNLRAAHLRCNAKRGAGAWPLGEGGLGITKASSFSTPPGPMSHESLPISKGG